MGWTETMQIFLGVSILVIFMLSLLRSKFKWVWIWHGIWRSSESCLQRRNHLKEDIFFPFDPLTSSLALQTTAEDPFQPLSINRFHMEARLRPRWHMLGIRHQRSYRKWHQGINILTLLSDFFLLLKVWENVLLSLGKSRNSNVPLIFRVKWWVSSEGTRAAPRKLTFLGQNACLSMSALFSLRWSPSTSLFSFL